MAAVFPPFHLTLPWRLRATRWRAPPPSILMLACCALAGVSVALCLPNLPAWPLLASVLLTGIAMLARGGRGGMLVGMVLVGVGYGGLQAAHALSLQWRGAPMAQPVSLRGQIVDLPQHDGRRTRFVFEVDAASARDAGLRGRRVRLSWFDHAEAASPPIAFPAGSRWELPVRLRAPRGLRNPGGVDAEKHALADRIAATGHVSGPALARQIAPATGLHAWRERLSARIVERAPDRHARFVQALALGDTRALTDDDWAVLRAMGLTHLIAISGFHVGIVAGFGALLCAGLWWLWPALARRLPRQHACGVAAVVAASGYAVLAGGAVPTVRTVLMIAMVVAARLLRRRQQGGDALALALLAMLAMDPLALLTAGFWLSFAGVAWLLWSLPPERASEPTPTRRVLRDLVAAQTVATLGLLPLTVVLFGQASLLGPLANLVAVPWWSLVVVPLALLGVLLEALHPGWGSLPWLASAHTFGWTWPAFSNAAQAPLAMAWLPEPGWYALPLALAGAAWWLLPRGVPGKALATALWLPLLWPSLDAPRHGEAELVVIDVGQGLSVLVRTQHHHLLFDMGPASPDGYDAGERAVLPALRALGVRHLDAAIISHGDGDHAGGWPSVAAQMPVLAALAPQDSPAPGTAACVAGTQWRWDGVTVRILHPSPGFPYLANESSCVVRIETAHGSALLTGDIGQIVERKLLHEQGRWLRNDVVLIAHHGSGGSSDPAFVAATQARLAVVSSGADNRFRHPRPVVVQRWCDAGADVRDTAEAGALRIRIGAEGLQANERRADVARLWDAARRRAQVGGLCYRRP